MSKHVPTKPQSLMQSQAPLAAENSGVTNARLSQDGSALVDGELNEGDGIGLMIGIGTPKTSPVKRQALIAAANAGDARAQFLLAERYRIGDKLTERDYAQALGWYRAAAEQGNPDAQNNLGSMFLNGLGVPKDAVLAVKWYRLAAAQGLPVAQFNLGMRRLHGQG